MPTFAVTVFAHLKQVLLAYGWHEDTKNPDFAYTWDGKGKVHRIPGTGYRGSGGKRAFFRIMAEQGFAKYLPVTYSHIDEVPEIDQTYFVKGDYGSYSKQIAVYHTYRDLVAGLPTLPYNKHYVIQPAVERPLLYQGYKQSFRVYVLTLATGEVYVYKRIFSALGGKPFHPESRELEAHIPVNNAARIEVTHPQLRRSIIKAAADIGHAYTRAIPYESARYALYGVDVLIDEDGRPWVIENNVSCDLSPSHNPGSRNEIIDNMAKDLYTLLIAPSVLGTVPQPGHFIKV